MIECLVLECGKNFHRIVRTHLKKHGLTKEQYSMMFPQAEFISKEFKEKKSRIMKESFASGKTKSWNKGKTKEDDERIRINAKNISKALKGNTYNIGLTKETDSRVKKGSEIQKENYKTGKQKSFAKTKSKEEVAEIYRKIGEKGSKTRIANPEKYSGKNNPMFGKSVFDVWVEKIGYEKALAKLRNIDSKPNISLKEYLAELNIEFIPEFRIYDEINKIAKFYDEYIPVLNLLIEVDGIYWHCNPENYKNGLINKIQEQAILNDKLKNELAVRKNYNILRISEGKEMNSFIEYLKKEKAIKLADLVECFQYGSKILRIKI